MSLAQKCWWILICVSLPFCGAIVVQRWRNVRHIDVRGRLVFYNRCLVKQEAVCCVPMQEDDSRKDTVLKKSPKRYGPPVHTEADFCALKRRVYLLETLVSELCGAMLYSDDMSLVERNTAEIGMVYRDGSFTESRAPAFARRRIESVLQKYQVSAVNQPHTWVRTGTSLVYNETGSGNATNTSTTVPVIL